jgi:Bacterial protein of unknown function (DUF899)
MAKGKVEYNVDLIEFPSADAPGISVFYNDKGGTIFHTYSAYARGTENVVTYNYLDLVPVPFGVSGYFVIVTLAFWGHCDRRHTADRCKRKRGHVKRACRTGCDRRDCWGAARVGLRERKKARLRRQIIDTSIKLFRKRGYEATRADDIVQALEISLHFFDIFRPRTRFYGKWENVGMPVFARGYVRRFRARRTRASACVVSTWPWRGKWKPTGNCGKQSYCRALVSRRLSNRN